ncbi:ABC transporter ATP-binding protein [Hoeflea prorocentri]|uniref:ABC transporter ATP-binding protein n=1 Tax=Hoeflea prorocentri TaxID=1922333 RepID=A0A9X3ZJ28_9HYPH|nr:ABC transporter ATP-binding protein [Hoeflea prorocentri]MCY6382603.1 ABC transporter ATP-binding protein [Hoeflea prorocentri]MDA5400403.1 ABC transporter ATP-binding protein [Hoeflea prorocentri]
MADAAPFLEITNLTAGYKRGLPIVQDLSLQVAGGEVVTVIGPNGAGKSTVLKAIAGLIVIEGGTIRLSGSDIVCTAPDRLGQFDLSYVPQTANIFTTLTVAQNLALAARRCRTAPQERIAAMQELFPDLSDHRNIRGGGLSGGQRQMLAIAMAMIAEPRIILMDEPTAGLSPKASQDVLKVVRSIAEDGVSVLLVEQNARLALGISDRAYILADGRNQLDGSARDILNDPAVAEIYLGGRRKGAA